MVIMKETTILLILLIHWLADAVLQTEKQATNKWNNADYLTAHTSTYSIVWLLFTIGMGFNFYACLAFTGITFLVHTITDGITSKITHNFFEKKDYHNGFVMVLFDQILHYIQLYLTWKLLFL
jgi:hypothetical protein